MQVGTKNAQGLIFDFDGTLVDSMWVWDEVDRVFLAKRALPYSEEFAEMIAVLGFERGADFVIDHFGLDEKPEDIIEEWKSLAEDGYSSQVMLKPGAREYLEFCKSQGMPMAIATSLQRHLLEPALENNGISGMFDAVCICDELQCGGKSNPTVYLEAARRLDVPAQHCAIFEDVAAAAKSAKQTGGYVVGVYDEHKQQATDELVSTVDLFIMSYSELLEEALSSLH